MKLVTGVCGYTFIVNGTTFLCRILLLSCLYLSYHETEIISLFLHDITDNLAVNDLGGDDG